MYEDRCSEKYDPGVNEGLGVTGVCTTLLWGEKERESMSRRVGDPFVLLFFFEELGKRKTFFQEEGGRGELCISWRPFNRLKEGLFGVEMKEGLGILRKVFCRRRRRRHGGRQKKR